LGFSIGGKVSLLVRRSAAVLICVGILLFVPKLSAQTVAQYASGISTTYSYFDPLNPSQSARIPVNTQQQPVVVPRPPILLPNAYQQQKSPVPPRIPIGLPALVSTVPVGTVPPRAPLATNPSLSFEGIQQTNFVPPSTNIAAGPEDIIQIVNATVARYSKAGKQTDVTLLQQWFGDLAPLVCSSVFNCIYGDVSIRYDQLHGHFLMTLQVLDTSYLTSYFLISISNGTTYSSGWRNWALNARNDGTTPTANWADFPQIGFDNDAVYITCNMFSFSAFTFQYAKVRILKKMDLYNQAATTLPYQDIFNLKNEDATVASTLQVPHLRGRPYVGTGTGVMINASDVIGADYLTLWKINNPVSNAPTVTRTTIHGFWPYKYPAAAAQLNSPITLDTGPSSIGKVVMREGRLYIARNTGYADEPTTVTYDLVDVASAKVLAQSRWTNGNFFYPAFDVPATIGPGTDFPNDLIVNTTTAPGGSLTYAGLTNNVKSGEDVYDLTNGSTARWGDYNGAGIDPITGGMWISAEYAKKKNAGSTSARYGTWDAFFPWSSDQQFDDVPNTSSNFHFINVMKLWSLTKGCSAIPSLYCPTMEAPRETVAVFVVRAMFGDVFPYPAAPYFTDVPASSPNFPYIQKLRELGITVGCGPTTFCPTMIATREMAATFIIRAKMRNLFGDAFSYPATPYFTDVPATSSNFRFIQKLREFGFTIGCTATEFCPTSPVTREQLAVFTVRAFFN
jgi:hypothetical protein